MDLSTAAIGQVLIPVTDLERAIEFYRYTLGLSFLYSAAPQMAFFQCGGVRLLVGVPQSPATFQRGSAVYFQVPDIHSVYQELYDHGVEFRSEPHIAQRTLEKDTWLAEFSDPDGNTLVLMCETKAD